MTQLLVYWAGPVTTASAASKETAKFAIDLIKRKGHNVLTEHIAFDDALAWERAQAELGANICERDIAWQNDSDMCIADISEGSTGHEMMFNLGIRGIPVHAVHRANTRLSPMYAQLKHPRLTVTSFADLGELERIINQRLDTFVPPWTLRPNLIICDAIDGAGKGAVPEVLKSWAQERSIPLFDHETYSQQRILTEEEQRKLGPAAELLRVPTWEDVKKMMPGCKVLITAEPTWAGIGGLIRAEIIRKGKGYDYGPFTTAHAYSLDRHILYERLVSPALREGCIVFSGRSVITSEVYQPVQATEAGYSKELMLGAIRGLAGNQLALNHVPGMMLIIHPDVDVAQQRLEKRTKDDKTDFERRTFQVQAAQGYFDERLVYSYERKGTKWAPYAQYPGETRETTKANIRKIVVPYIEKVVA